MKENALGENGGKGIRGQKLFCNRGKPLWSQPNVALHN